jgi:hypothetical protein
MDTLQQARLEFKRKISIITQIEPGLSREEHAKLVKEFLVPVELKMKEIEEKMGMSPQKKTIVTFRLAHIMVDTRKL